MLKGDKKYIYILTGCFVLLITLQLLAPKPVDWKLSYLKKDKIPYGASLLYSLLQSLFQEDQVLVKDVPLYNSLKNNRIQNTGYIIINDEFAPDKLDVQELQHFVREGNNVFISANSFSTVFMDSLKFATSVLLDASIFAKPDTLQQKIENDGRGTLRLYLCNPAFNRDKAYDVNMVTGTCFTKFDTAASVVLGTIRADKLNFIRMRYGKGYFYLHLTPEIFINYNLLRDNNISYAEKVFSYLPAQQQLIWDDYYKAGKNYKNNPLRVILNSPALAMAYYLLIFSILLFMLIGIKRKQRIIPVIEPLQNTTLEFVNTVGALYYLKGSHKEIAEKQINHFLSFLKTTFRMTTFEYDDVFINKIAALSGVERTRLVLLFKCITDARTKLRVSEQEILQLNKMIEDFYKLNKRSSSNKL